MPEFARISDAGRRPLWPYIAISFACVCLVIWLKFPGVMLSIIIIGATTFMTQHRPNTREVDSLRASIRLTLEDIQDILTQYDKFETGTDMESIADRTLYRPALLDPESSDPDIEAFHYLRKTSRRFLTRADGHLTKALTIGQLEKILEVTDRRASDFEESWIAARRAAKRLSEN